MAQHGIEPIQTEDEATATLDDLFGKRKGQKTKTMQSKQHFANIFDGGKENDY